MLNALSATFRSTGLQTLFTAISRLPSLFGFTHEPIEDQRAQTLRSKEDVLKSGYQIVRTDKITN